jgi:hypothetical protein
MEKNGGLNNTTPYIGMMPAEKLSVVILFNRGSENADARIGRRIMLRLAPLFGSLNNAAVAPADRTRVSPVLFGRRAAHFPIPEVLDRANARATTMGAWSRLSEDEVTRLLFALLFVP